MNIEIIKKLYSLDESKQFLMQDYHTFDFDEHIAQIFVSNKDYTEIIVEEYVSKNLEFVHEEPNEKENVFETLKANHTNH